LIRRLAFLLCAVAVALGAVAVYLVNADLGRFKDQLTPLVSKSLGRELHIDGDLSLHLGRTVMLRAADVSIANSAWATGPHLVQAASVDAEVDLWSLIRGPVRVESLVLRGALIRLQEGDDGRRNWLKPGFNSAKEGNDDDARDALPRIAALRASDVQIILEARALTGVSEIIVDTADFAVDDNLLTVNTSGKVNSHPLALAIRMAPVQPSSTAGALRIDADVRMGEVSLDADLLLEDANTFAVSAAELELNGPDVDYVLSVLKLPKITSGPLAIKASLQPDPQHSAFDLQGRIGEYDFAARGWLEDITGNGGFDESTRLAGPSLAALGRPFNIETLPDLPFEVETELRSRDAGIKFDDTRVLVGEEQAHGRGGIVWLPDGGQELDVQAEYRDMSLTALVNVPASWPVSQLRFNVSSQGGNAVEVARHLGLDHLDGQPFVLSASGTYGDQTVSLGVVNIAVGEQRVALTGRAELLDNTPDIELRFDAESIDLTPWLGDREALAAGLRAVAGTGRIKLSQGRLEADELALRSSDVSLEGHVSLPLVESGREGQFALHLKAPSLDKLLNGFTGTAIHEQPIDLRADGSWNPGEW
jgi:AsmA-like protein